MIVFSFFLCLGFLSLFGAFEVLALSDCVCITDRFRIYI